MGTIAPNQPFVATLAARKELAPGILEVRLNRPAGLRFIPGQFMRFLDQGCQRDYTVVSAADAETLDFCIAMVEEGRFSQKIQQAAIGDEFQLSGPHGYFVFQGNLNPAVFVATGTGIAPFVAFLRSGIEGATLLHGVPSSNQLVYRDMLSSAVRTYVPCVSRLSGDRDDPPEVFAGRVTDYLIQKLTPGIYDFYLCGRRSMIQDATVMIDSRFPGSRLFSEAYD